MNGIAGRSWAWARVGTLALLWGSTFLWIKLALAALSPAQLTFARCVLGALTLTAFCFGTRQRLPGGRRIWGHLFVAAFFCNALPFSLFSIGQQTVSSGVAGVLNATTPLWTLLVGVVLGTERAIRPTRLGGVLLGFGGVVLISAPWQSAGSVGWGSLAIVAAAASYAIGFAYMGRNLAGKGIPTISLSAGQLIAATALTALTLPTGGPPPVHISQQGLIAVVILGIFATGITFHLTFRIIADEGATNAATVGYLLPVVSVLLGAIVLGEGFSIRVAIGMVVVLIGVAMTRLRKPTVEIPQPTEKESVRQ
ncbi:drug/metabolite transporter (DMT)-like permease [Kibdelosporangium banguiense]|uniref:Drug/metabolite transporter (DMT)-like permease n=1 Tax=Kibdelosporangium banguiense TaxID=1365924 RepID=A0ABS4TP57_9PSEU|nr:DMT family transporter [Kibdelosporangium banguiense]MBP2325745.1 drug/metabolite transporter (DMT)-like permease [Kibdelosporangium banguiense]